MILTTARIACTRNGPPPPPPQGILTPDSPHYLHLLHLLFPLLLKVEAVQQEPGQPTEATSHKRHVKWEVEVSSSEERSVGAEEANDDHARPEETPSREGKVRPDEQYGGHVSRQEKARVGGSCCCWVAVQWRLLPLPDGHVVVVEVTGRPGDAHAARVVEPLEGP